MSVATELTRLISAKSALRTSIIAKGVFVPSAATLDAYAAYVDLIDGSPPLTVPAAFVIGDWTAAAVGLTGQIAINIISLPTSDATITEIQYRIAGGTPATLPGGTATGSRNISGFTDGVPTNVEIRAISEIGAGEWSDVKSVTSTEADPGLTIVRVLTRADQPYGGTNTITFTAITSGNSGVVCIGNASASAGPTTVIDNTGAAWTLEHTSSADYLTWRWYVRELITGDPVTEVTVTFGEFQGSSMEGYEVATEGGTFVIDDTGFTFQSASSTHTVSVESTVDNTILLIGLILANGTTADGVAPVVVDAEASHYEHYAYANLATSGIRDASVTLNVGSLSGSTSWVIFRRGV